ncbi:hypothetical protein [Haladaptatus cibarius]|uniref:hypothetical protein n=1 Tax=Haladaptatus cibarius TaxID=453847 RepID=UPI00067926BC|nr:hypothetical protein [Haladaptatus cibarius]
MNSEKEDTGQRETDEDIESCRRRDYLKLGATAVTGAAFAGAVATGSVSAATTRKGISFSTVVDAVDDLGWDPDGDVEIPPPTDDDTLIEVPPGEYVFPSGNSDNAFVYGTLKNWGIRGTGTSPGDVVFRTSDGNSENFVFSTYSSDGVLIENVTFDNTKQKEGGDIGLILEGQDNIEVHDVETIGFSGQEPYCRESIHVILYDSAGEANVVNYKKTGPSVFVGHGESDGGGHINRNHDGLVRFKNCRIENQGGDGGLYTGKHDGKVIFEDFYFANNDMAAIRTGAGSELHNSEIVMDTDNDHPDNVFIDDDPDTSEDESPTGAQGIYFSSAQFGKSGGGVYNCDIKMLSTYNDSMGAIRVNPCDGNLEIKDTTITVELTDSDGMPAILALGPEDQRGSTHQIPEKPWGLTIDNVTINGNGEFRTNDNGFIYKGVVVLENRPGSVVRNSCIETTGGAPGIDFMNSDNCSVENTNINVDGTAILPTSGVSKSGITYDEACPLPDDGTSPTEPSYSGATAVEIPHVSDTTKAGVQFDLTNEADSNLTITGMSITSADTSIDRLYDNSDSVGEWVSELYIDADVQTGVTDVSGATSLPTTLDLDADGWDDSADANAILSAGSSATVSLGRFESGTTPVEMVGESMDISIDYTVGGTSGTKSFTVTPTDGTTADLTYGNDATATDISHDSSTKQCAVEFSVTNNAGTEMTLTEMTVTPADTSIDGLWCRTEAIGKWESEIYVESDVQAGVTDVSAGASLPRTFDMDADGWSDSADANAILSSGSTAGVFLSRFESNDSLVEMGGKSVDVTIDYTLASGESGSETLTLQP